MKMITMTNMKTVLLALALGAGATTAGCGETSYFEVSLVVKPDPGTSCVSRGYTCTVLVSGADSGYFSLAEGACRMRTNPNLGLFQFATDKESGTVNFEVTLYDGTIKNVLAKGTAGASIKSGGRQPLMVELVPNDAVLDASGCR